MKPVIVGMNNPISTRPGHELYPAPDGCTGHRLWQLLNTRTGASRVQYLDSFERRNLVRGPMWDRLAARARAYEVVCELRDSGRTIVLLGQEVRMAFDFALRNEQFDWSDGLRQGLPPLLIHPQQAAGCTWRQVPHPSARVTWYDRPENVKLVELLMEELYNEYHRQQMESAR